MQSPDPNGNYHRAYLREKRARRQAEEILETRSRELFEANARIETQYANLEASHDQLKEAQGQLVQSEKMASVGQLAAGIAHEINNPMAFISSNLNTLSRTAERFAYVLREYESFVASARQVAPGLFASSLDTLDQVLSRSDVRYLLGDMKEIVEDSREGADRVSEIVLGLRNFSRLDDDTPKIASVNEGLRGTLKIAASEIQYQHVIETDYGDIPDIFCFAGQLNQVFLNLIVNASQACSKNGRILVRTFVESGHVVVEIDDNGKGIDPKHLNAIFNPFFTTKDVGQGTGLGLSISYAIIKKHGGDIQVTSERGKGTTFRVMLPMEDAMPAEATDRTRRIAA
ncbi:MAG: hypothetical protein KJP16_03100 [Gammaproteobacteria bacterium]|nr:hypothetical protein [Gammaproteobacteria bacterium]NNL49781.1 hypothetical protein [Woeseiaceae bacterium]